MRSGDDAPLRVLHIAAPGMVGGLERVLCTLAVAQCRAGIEARVALIIEPACETPPLLAQLHAEGVPAHPIVIRGRAYLRERAAVAALCHQWQPDVVHTHGYRADVVDSGAARRLGIPCLTTFHGMVGGDWRNRLYEAAQRRVARRLDAVIAVSKPIGDRLRASGVRAAALHVIPNAHEERVSFEDRVVARRELGLPGEGFVVGWLGRLSREKGADVLLDALRLPGAEDVHAAFLGDGPQRAALRARCAASRLQGRVTWHGQVVDAARFLRAFDAFVLSSRTEGTPMTLFEAMEAGTPIVATRVGGVPAVVRPSEALLVPSEDPPSIAAALRAIRQDPASAGARANMARARLAAEYRVGPWVQRYEAVYRHIQRPRATVAR